LAAAATFFLAGDFFAAGDAATGAGVETTTLSVMLALILKIVNFQKH